MTTTAPLIRHVGLVLKRPVGVINVVCYQIISFGTSLVLLSAAHPESPTGSFFCGLSTADEG